MAPFYVNKVATSSQSGKEGPLIAACGRVDAVDPKYIKLTFYITGNFFPLPPFKKWLI